MHMFVRNVNEAFTELVELFNGGDDYDFQAGVVKKQSRNGPVLVIDEPVTVTYSHPKERVLFNQARDCNPFFHLYESLWMLAGRNDIKPLAYYAKNMLNYSDDGVTQNGAYGYRWRSSYRRPLGTVSSWSNDEQRQVHYHHEDASTVDQLQLLIDHLKVQPDSRRAVLQMWNVEDDLLQIGRPCEVCMGTGKINNRMAGSFSAQENGYACETCSGTKIRGASKDVCCNLSVMFSIRKDRPLAEDGVSCATCIARNKVMHFRDPGPCPSCGGKYGSVSTAQSYLDMTVINRSNDLIWGMLGANVVHFSILQEYMAAHLGVEVGVYNHFTNNLHVYESNWKPKEWLKEDLSEPGYNSADIQTTVPLIKDPAQFDKELPEFVDWYSKGRYPEFRYWKEPFFNDVAQPMLTAFGAHKAGYSVEAVKYLDNCKADDWRITATNWINKRIKNKEK